MPRVAYTPEQMDEVRLKVAELGSARAAARETGVSPDTANRWTKGKHGPRFQQIVDKLKEQRDERLIGRFNQNAAAAAASTALAIEKTDELLEQGNIKDANLAAGTARNLATTFGIAMDKSYMAQGKPVTTIQHRRDTDELLHSLRQLTPQAFIEGTADEIPADPELERSSV